MVRRSPDRYRDIGEIFDVAEPDIGDALARYLTDLSERIGLPTRLSQVGVPEDGIPALVEGAMGDGTTLLNPREMGEDDYAELYRGRCSDQRGQLGAVRRHRASVASRVLRAPAQLLARSVVFISTGFTEWIQATASGIRGRRVATSAVALHERLRHRYRVPAERVRQVRHGERAARREVVGPGSPIPRTPATNALATSSSCTSWKRVPGSGSPA